MRLPANSALILHALLLITASKAGDSTEYEGMKVLCVGCSSGIGRATAEILLRGGANVVVSSWNEAECREVVEPHPLSGTVVRANVSEPQELESLAYQARQAMGGSISHLVWCPTSLKFVPWQGEAEAIVDSIKDQMEINIYGLARLYKWVRDDLMAAQGALVSVSSVSAGMPTFGRPSYGIAKAAQERLIQDIALDLSVAGARANAIRPGATDTPIFNLFKDEEVKAKMKAEYAWRHALKRLAQPEEMGHMIAFLLSDKAGFLTGQIISIDGGLGLLNSMVDLYSPLLIPTEQQKQGHFVFQQREMPKIEENIQKEPEL